MLIGYARVSTRDQKPHLQLDALQEAGCERVFEETASGAKRDRPELKAVLDFMRAGDNLVVWGCKPKPQKFPSHQIEPLHDRIQVDDLAVTAERVVPVQMDVPPSRRRNLSDQRERFRVPAHLVLGE